MGTYQIALDWNLLERLTSPAPHNSIQRDNSRIDNDVDINEESEQQQTSDGADENEEKRKSRRQMAGVDKEHQKRCGRKGRRKSKPIVGHNTTEAEGLGFGTSNQILGQARAISLGAEERIYDIGEAQMEDNSDGGAASYSP
jgi:hypothetical protein